MSFHVLQERLSALQETISQLRSLIDRLGNLQFQPGSVPLGTSEEDSVSGELSGEIGQVLRGGLEEQELLQEEIKFLRPDGDEKSKLQDDTERAGKDLISCRFAFRKARLAAKKSLVEAQKLERELLLQSYAEPRIEETPSATENGDASTYEYNRPPRMAQSHHQKSSLSEGDQQTVGASSNVTNALRRTHELIATELARSDFAHQTLTESSAALKKLDESYGSLDTMLMSSRDLLGTLLRSQKSDTWYLQTAFYMLAVTGSWLLFRRIFYGPIWWLVWLPLKLMLGLGRSAGGLVLQGQTYPEQSTQVSGQDAVVGVPVEGLPKGDLLTAQVGGENAEDLADEEIERIVGAVHEMNEEGKAARTSNAVKKEGERQTTGEADGRIRDEL